MQIHRIICFFRRPKPFRKSSPGFDSLLPGQNLFFISGSYQAFKGCRIYASAAGHYHLIFRNDDLTGRNGRLQNSSAGECEYGLHNYKSIVFAKLLFIRE